MTAAFDRISDALERAQLKTAGSGAALRAQCPAHGSRGLTLSLRAAEDRALLHCFAGCLVVDVLDALGLRLAGLYDEPGTGHSSAGTPRVRRDRSPWDALGDVEHVAHRAAVEVAKEEAEPDEVRRRREVAEYAANATIVSERMASTSLPEHSPNVGRWSA